MTIFNYLYAFIVIQCINIWKLRSKYYEVLLLKIYVFFTFSYLKNVFHQFNPCLGRDKCDHI